MGNLKSKQQGSVHLAVTVVLAVALIGALGWILWQNLSKTKSETATSQSKTKNEAKTNEMIEKKDVTADWLTYTSPQSDYEVRIPDGWRLHDSDGLLHVWSDMRAGRLDYVPGTIATIEKLGEGGRDGIPTFWLYFRAMPENAPTGVKQDGFKTSQGLLVEKRYTLWEQPDESIMAPAEGTKQYVYEVTKEDKGTVSASYYFSPGEFSQKQLELVEELVKTIKLL